MQYMVWWLEKRNSNKAVAFISIPFYNFKSGLYSV